MSTKHFSKFLRGAVITLLCVYALGTAQTLVIRGGEQGFLFEVAAHLAYADGGDDGDGTGDADDGGCGNGDSPDWESGIIDPFDMSLIADPTTVNAGESSTLSWDSGTPYVVVEELEPESGNMVPRVSPSPCLRDDEGVLRCPDFSISAVDSCTASLDWSGDKAIPLGSESTGALLNNKTYTLTCHYLNFDYRIRLNKISVRYFDGGEKTKTATVLVGEQIPQMCQEPGANNIGSPLPCTYDTCQDPAANNIGQPLPCHYDLKCPSGQTNGNANACVDFSFWADSYLVPHKESTMLRWRLPENYGGYWQNCQASGDWSGEKTKLMPVVGTVRYDGEESTGPLTRKSTYHLECSFLFTGEGVYGKKTKTVVVDVGPPTESKPDLTAGATTLTPSAALVGQSESLSASVSNIGERTASNFPNMFQIATDNLLSTIAMVNAGTISTLASGDSIGVSGLYAFSSAGTYKVRACANYDTSWGGSINEVSLTNNCGTWTTITVSNPQSVPAVSAYISAGSVVRGSSATVPYGGSFNELHYESSNATSCKIFVNGAESDWGPSGPPLSFTWGVTGPYYSTLTWDFTCYNATGQSAHVPITLNVEPEDVGGGPSLSCSRSPSNPSLPAPATVTYTATPASGATGPYTFRDALNTVLQSGGSTTYQTTYTTAGDYAVNVSSANVSGSASCGAPVTVTGGSCSGPTTGDLTATPSRVRSGNGTNLAWTNVSGVNPPCRIVGTDGYTSGNLPVNSCNLPNGGDSTPGITTQTTYRLMCNSAEVDKVIVNILPAFEEF